MRKRRLNNKLSNSNKILAQNEAKKILTSILDDSIPSNIIIDDYNWIAYRVQLYLQELETANRNLVSQIDLQSSMLKQLGNEISPEFQQNLISKYVLAKIDTQLTTLLKKGYQIIAMLRQSFTGEVIKYAVAVEFYGKTYEGYLTEEQILRLASPSFDRGTNVIKLRLDALSKSRIIETMKNNENYTIIDDKKSEQHSTLYSSIRAYVNRGEKRNIGNVYEAYRVLKARYHNNNIPPAIWDKNEFESVYISTIKNTQSYVKGGDLFDEQFKFFGKSYPSLTTINTIRSTLTTFVALTQQLPQKDQLEFALKQMFYKQNQLNNAAADLSNGAEEIINNLLKNIRYYLT